MTSPHVIRGVWERAATTPIVLASAAVVFGATAWLSLAGEVTRYGLLSLAGVVSLLVLGRVVASSRVRVPVIGALASIGRDSIVYYTVHWVVIAAAANVLALTGFAHPEVSLLILLLTGIGVSCVFVRLNRRIPVVAALFVSPTSARRR